MVLYGLLRGIIVVAVLGVVVSKEKPRRTQYRLFIERSYQVFRNIVLRPLIVCSPHLSRSNSEKVIIVASRMMQKVSLVFFGHFPEELLRDDKA